MSCFFCSYWKHNPGWPKEMKVGSEDWIKDTLEQTGLCMRYPRYSETAMTHWCAEFCLAPRNYANQVSSVLDCWIRMHRNAFEAEKQRARALKAEKKLKEFKRRKQ